MRREVFQKLGYYRLDYRVAADYEFITRLVEGGVLLKRLPKIIVKIREGGARTTGILGRIHQNI